MTLKLACQCVVCLRTSPTRLHRSVNDSSFGPLHGLRNVGLTDDRLAQPLSGDANWGHLGHLGWLLLPRIYAGEREQILGKSKIERFGLAERT